MLFGGHRWPRLFGGLLIALWLAGMPTVRAAPSDALQAAFVLNFLKFAEWPSTTAAGNSAPLIVATLGEDELATVLKSVLHGKTVQGRKVAVHMFRDATAWQAAAQPCQAIFITPAAQAAWAELRADLSRRPVLTMGVTPGFCAAGMMLNLYEQDNRIRFEANQAAVALAGLKVRAELLKLAKIVNTEGSLP
jgi:hypothetical protein